MRGCYNCLKRQVSITETGIIFNIQKFCIHDGDGIRTCVFLKGCPLRCIWCHNPESLDKDPAISFNNKKCSTCGKCIPECPARIIKNGNLEINREKCVKCGKCIEICLNDANEIIGKKMTTQEAFDEVLKDKIFYDTSGGGLTVSGGEPSYQPAFTLELLSLAKESGINLAIETCGIGSQEFYKKCADLGATFLFDIKCLDPARHKTLTDVDNAHILSNLHYLMDRNADIIIRLPLIPDCNDSDEDIARLCDFLTENKGRYRYAEIMPYHTLGINKAEKLGTTTPYVHDSATDEEITRWTSIFKSHSIDIRVSK